MIQTQTKFPVVLFVLPLLVLLFGLVRFGLPDLPNRATEPSLVPVYQVPFNLTVTASGEVEVPLPTDGAGMPNCDDFELKGCGWESKLRRKINGDDQVIETVLTKDGKVVGRAQVLEVETSEYIELKPLADAGYKKAWLSHIQVARAYRGGGLGRALWQASDAMIKVLVGGGNAVHIFVDQAGWGPALLRNVPQRDLFPLAADTWAYIVR